MNVNITSVTQTLWTVIHILYKPKKHTSWYLNCFAAKNENLHTVIYPHVVMNFFLLRDTK